MADGSTVGTIYLDLKVLGDVHQQINDIASRAGKQAAKSFGGIGKDIGETLEKSLEKSTQNAAKVMDTPLNDAKKQAEQTADEIRRIAKKANQLYVDSFNPKDVNLPVTAQSVPSGTATSILNKKGETDSESKVAPPDLSDTFKPASDSTELLRQKVANLNLQLDAERQKLAGLNAEFAKIDVGTRSWDDLSNKITASESKLISLQSSINSTQNAIEAPARKAAEAAERAAKRQKAAAEKAAEAQKRAAEKATEAKKKAAEAQSNAVKRAEEKEKQARNKSLKSTMKPAQKLGSSIKSAFKSTFLMAGLYTAFKGMRTLMTNAATQNKEFAKSLNSVKANLSVAFQPIIDAVMPAITILMNGLAQAAQAVASFISSLFGKTYAESAAATKKAQAASAKSGGGEKSGSLASFDKLNVLQQDNGGAETGGVDYDALGTEGNAAAEGLAEKFKQTWAGIASGFQDYVIAPLTSSLDNFSAPIERFKALFSGIGEQCKAWVEPILQWFQTDFKETLGSHIENTSIVWSGFLDSLAMISETVWESVKPVIDWLVVEGLPILTDMWRETSDACVAAFDAIKIAFDTVWKDVIDPFCKFVSKAVTGVLEEFKRLWDEYGKTTFENIRKAINSAKAVFLAGWNNVFKPIFDKIFDVLNRLWTEHLQPLIGRIGEFVMKLVNGAMEIYNGFIAPVAKWFNETIGPVIANVIGVIVEKIGWAVGCIIDAASNIFKALGGVIDFIVGIFTGNWEKAWQGIQDIFSGIFGALFNIAKVPINAIIGLLNGAIEGINMLIKGLNKISFDIPDWVPKLGGKSFGINIPLIKNIPYLAGGGVIDQPTLAMVGESGREAVMPLENNTGWIRELAAQICSMLAQYIQAGTGKQEIVIRLSGSLEELVRILKPELDKETTRLGVRLVTGGAR